MNNDKEILDKIEEQLKLKFDIAESNFLLIQQKYDNVIKRLKKLEAKEDAPKI